MTDEGKKHKKNELIHPKLGKLTPKPLSNLNEFDEEIYCICHKPDNGELMVACDGCDDWFHFKCVKIPQKYNGLIFKFFCPYCELNDGDNKIQYKRKCRISSCFKPIMNQDSKYCSKEHGKLFLENVLKERVNVNRDDLLQVVQFTDDFKHFKQIGDELPKYNSDDERLVRIANDIKKYENLKQFEYELNALLIKSKDSLKKQAKVNDICGFESKFRSFDLDDLFKLNNDEIDALIPSVQDSTEQCSLERKKCIKHNGWQSIVHDEIEMNLSLIEQQIDLLNLRRVKLTKVITVDYFTKQGDFIKT